MIPATADESNDDAPAETSLRKQFRDLVDGLREEVESLREEVTALRRRESPDGPDTLLTREEAADRLRISTRTLDDLADAGEIQPVRIRGRVLYHPDTLQAYIRERSRGEAGRK
jgi:excisionase family DNA binding protein